MKNLETIKPVPNVESLQYKGTEERKDIKIFVSHRIDLDSEIVDNPIYIPVRCGAMYDNRENVSMLGDDTGDNISEKKMSFCEFTVMYWAWKNVLSDYYGLCHYRRYLSPLEKDLKGHAFRQGVVDSMSLSSLEYCGLLDEENIRRQIEAEDMLVPYEYSLDEIEDDSKNVWEFWIDKHSAYLQNQHLELMMRLIHEYSPEYYTSAVEYAQGKKFIGFNCFVMKRELFQQMCEFIFPILFAFDDMIDKSHFSTTQKRAAGYLGEWLFSVFVYHSRKNKYKVKEKQLLHFQCTNKSYPLSPAFAGKNVPIVLPVTDNNRPYVGVQIQSILSHISNDKMYDIILLRRSYDDDRFNTYLRQQSDRSLLNLAEGNSNVSIRMYDPKDELLRVDIHEFGTAYTEEQYYLLLLAWILEKYDRVIYLQDSMIVETDIAELMDVDLSDTCVAAVKDIFHGAKLNGFDLEYKTNFEDKVKLSKPYDYVTTDVVILNLKKIRADYKHAEVIELIEERNIDSITKDGFNILFENKITFLPQMWNMVEAHNYQFYVLQEYFPAEDYDEQTKSPKMLNTKGFEGQELPVQSFIAKRFWSYARETEFYEELISNFVIDTASDLVSNIIMDDRTGVRKFADEMLPHGSKRRAFAKMLVPRDSLRWKACKQLYYIVRPDCRPQK